MAIAWHNCTGICWAIALEPFKLPLILSRVCSPISTNYCWNLVEDFFFFSLLSADLHLCYFWVLHKRVAKVTKRISLSILEKIFWHIILPMRNAIIISQWWAKEFFFGGSKLFITLKRKWKWQIPNINIIFAAK